MTYVPPTPAHYIAAHSAGYTGFRDMVVEAAEWWLCRHPGIHSTKDLSDGLWPNRLAHGHDIEIRKRLVDALLKCADRELKAYAHRGPTTGKVYGHAKRPWLWSKPEASLADLAVTTPGDGAPACLQNLCDWIGATAPGQFISVRDRERIATEILSKAHVTLK